MVAIKIMMIFALLDMISTIIIIIIIIIIIMIIIMIKIIMILMIIIMRTSIIQQIVVLKGCYYNINFQWMRKARIFPEKKIFSMIDRETN